MSKRATTIQLTPKDREVLEDWLRIAGFHQRMAERARIVLLAAEGRTTEEIARGLGTRPARVSKWRTRFAAVGLTGLADGVKTGKPPRYGATVEARILQMIDQPPPAGRRAWTGELVAKALGDVSADQVWRVLRKRGIRLARRRGHYLDAESEFAPRQVDIAGIYLDRTTSAIALCAPPPDAGEAAGVFHIPDSRLATCFRSGAAGEPIAGLTEILETAATLVRSGRFVGPGRRGFADFVADLAAMTRLNALHVLFTAEGARRPEVPNAVCHQEATHAVWLRQVECWFAVFERPPAGKGWARRMIHAIDSFTSASKEREAAAFEWRRRASAGKSSNYGAA